MKNLKASLFGLLMLAMLTVGFGQSLAQQLRVNQEPNIILIIADDLGYSDLGSYGSEIQTPHLDKLASEGIRFTEFYNGSICAPTRGSLLTGQYAHRAGMGFFDTNLGLPAYQGYLNKESLTLGEVLGQNGYRTLMSGKWHVGSDSLAWPNQRGFDRFFGIPQGGCNYFEQAPMPLFGREYVVDFIEDNKRVHLDSGTYYFTDEITDRAIKFLREESESGKPFFLYLSYNAPHWPLQALPDDITKYDGKYDKGWDVLKEGRIKKQEKLGIRRVNDPIAPRDKDVKAWASLTYDEQQLWANKMEVFAAMVDRMDQGIGRVLSTLGQLQKDDNTLIIFISDNGAPAEDVAHVPNSNASRNSGPVGTAGSFESQGKEWSHASNAPLRSFKNSMYEGGFSSPFIAWFPQKIKAGSVTKGTGHIIDIAPTFYELANASYPKSYKGVTTNNLPGKSLLPVLYGKDTEVKRDEPLFWERAGNRAVRKGKWKIIADYPSVLWELYDIENDRAETVNLAGDHPEIVKELAWDYVQWAARTGVTDYESIKPKRFP